MRKILVGLVVLLTLCSSIAFGAAEKGPRCSDGLDNDGDTLIDAQDPDCGGTSESPVLEITDADGDYVGRIASIQGYSGSSGPQEVGVHVVREGRYLGVITDGLDDRNDVFDMNHGNRGPLFTEPECQGTPYIKMEDSPVWSLFLNYYYQDPIAGYGVIAKLTDQNQIPLDLVFLSHATGNGAECVTDSSQVWQGVVALEVVETGLPLFNPPYVFGP